jgi:hypothetical protein
LRALGYEAPEQLGAMFLGDAPLLRAWAHGHQPLTDNWPKRLTSDVTWPQWIGMDTNRMRERFANSAIVAGFMPESLRQATLPYFEAQKLINRAILHAAEPERYHDLPIAHRLLTQTALRELPLWHLGSNAHLQELAGRLRAKGVRHPWVEVQVAKQALVDRRYAQAAEGFRQAIDLGETRRSVWHDRLYALCMAGRVEEAEALAGSKAPLDPARPADAALFTFLGETFPGSSWPSSDR